MLNLRVLLVVAVICAAIGFAIFNQFPGRPYDAVLAGGFAFLALFSLLAALNAAAIKRRLDAAESGMHELENSMNKRLNELGAMVADRDEHHVLPTQIASNAGDHMRPVSSEIELNGSTNGKAKPKVEKPKLPASLEKLANGTQNGFADAPYANGHGDEMARGELCLHLQPIVDVVNRGTYGFQITPAYQGSDGEVSYIDYSVDSALPSTLWNPRLDLQIFSKSLYLVRKLRQKAPEVRVFIPFSGSIFSDKRYFKQMIQEVDANRVLAKHCVLCIDAETWRRVEKSKRSHLVDLLDSGFQAAICNCPDPTSLKKSFKLNQFSFYFASVANLGIDAVGQPSGLATSLQKLADEHDFKVVVSKVNHDYELIRLVDEDFPYAIGEYLSPAKAPNL